MKEYKDDVLYENMNKVNDTRKLSQILSHLLQTLTELTGLYELPLQLRHSEYVTVNIFQKKKELNRSICFASAMNQNCHKVGTRNLQIQTFQIRPVGCGNARFVEGAIQILSLIHI